MAKADNAHHFDWQDVGGIVVIHFKTTVLRDDRIIRVLFDQLEELIGAGRTKMVLNFSGLEAFASYAIGKLIHFNDKLKAPSGRLALCALPPMVEEIVDILNLHKKFQIYPTERAALESFV